MSGLTNPGRMLPPDGPQQMGTCSITYQADYDTMNRETVYRAVCSIHSWRWDSYGLDGLERHVNEHVAEQTPAPAEPDRKARLVHLAGALGLDESVGALMDGVVAEILRALDERAAVEPTRDESTLTDSGQSEPSSTEAQFVHECRWCGREIRQMVPGTTRSDGGEREWWHADTGNVYCNPLDHHIGMAEPDVRRADGATH